MPKKKNSFSFFLDHYFDDQIRKGRNISKRIAAEECGKLWKQLPDDKKQIYIDLAKAFKTEQDFVQSQFNNNLRDTFSSSSTFSETKPGNEIAYLVAHIRHEKALRNHKFYIIHCNYYCRTIEGIYLPGEIALSEFNLQDGITRTYHTLVNPGNVPLGYGYEVRKIANEVHGLPLPPHDEGEKNFGRILSAIYHFIKCSEEDEDDEYEYPPVFTIEENVQASTEVLNYLSQSDHSHLKVYSINRMFFWLKNKCTEYCGNEPGFPVLSNAITEIEKDVFRYCTGISCHFHSELQDKFQNCSLSIVQRLVYIICDHCCRHLNIKLVRGKHAHQNFVKRSDDSSHISIRSVISDLTSNPAEESDYCGASTYASSVFDDYRYELEERNYSEEEEEEEFLSAKGLSTLKFRDNSDDLVKKICGRGKPMGDVQQKVGLPRK